MGSHPTGIYPKVVLKFVRVKDRNVELVTWLQVTSDTAVHQTLIEDCSLHQLLPDENDRNTFWKNKEFILLNLW